MKSIFSHNQIIKIFGGLYDHLTETILVCFIADEEMFTGLHRYAEENMRKFMDMFGEESDDVRNMATTKVNPFKQDKENEAIQYEPIMPVKDGQSKVDKNLLNFLKADELDGTDDSSKEKIKKIEKFYDPINNTVQVHAQIIPKGEEDIMEKSIKSEETKNLSQNLFPEEKKSRPETPITQKPLSQTKIPGPLTQTKVPIISTLSNLRLPTPNQSNFKSAQNFNENNTNNKSINISRPTSQNQNNVSSHFNRPNSSDKNVNRPISSDKNASNFLKVENVSRPTSSNNKNDLNNSMNSNKDKSFVEIKKLEIEDLENSVEEDDKKSAYSMENSIRLEPKQIKNQDLSKNFERLNTQFNLDQNRMKNSTNIFSKSGLAKDSQFHF